MQLEGSIYLGKLKAKIAYKMNILRNVFIQ